MIGRIQEMPKRQGCTRGEGGTPDQAGNVLVDILVCLAFIGLLFMMVIAAV